MDITIQIDRLIYVLPALLVYCFALDSFIWHMNRRWLSRHPNQPRHPYSPAFTALGNLALTAGVAVLTNWQVGGLLLALNIVFGGLMWLLHARRWMFRS